LENSRKIQTPIPYNPKFHRFNGISIFQSDYSINNLHSKLESAPKKLQNVQTNSDYLLPKNYSHKYGRECENLLKMKT
jgi:hypothetical protein